jgi:hypothetical protein
MHVPVNRNPRSGRRAEPATGTEQAPAARRISADVRSGDVVAKDLLREGFAPTGALGRRAGDPLPRPPPGRHARVSRLAGALRRALRADRHHRARRVHRGDRGRRGGAPARRRRDRGRPPGHRRGGGPVVVVFRLGHLRRPGETGRGDGRVARGARERRVLVPAPADGRGHRPVRARVEDHTRRRVTLRSGPSQPSAFVVGSPCTCSRTSPCGCESALVWGTADRSRRSCCLACSPSRGRYRPSPPSASLRPFARPSSSTRPSGTERRVPGSVAGGVRSPWKRSPVSR